MQRALAFLCLLALCACETDLRESDAMFRISDSSGSINLKLIGKDASGREYRLRKATFEVSGNAMLTLQGRSHDDLSAPLPQGDYQMFLRPGYELVARDEDGSEHIVPAKLNSPNPARLHVSARTDGAVALSFRGEHGDIAFGRARGLHATVTNGQTVLAASTAP
jgi:hypothetical protein